LGGEAKARLARSLALTWAIAGERNFWEEAEGNGADEAEGGE
jgi:hypothetical protein